MIKKKQVSQVITVLRALNEKHYEDPSKKKSLLEDERRQTLYFQISLKKIPSSKLKMIKVNLPHRLLKDTDEVCLIAGDLDKKNKKAAIEPDILYYKEMLTKHGINDISEVMTLRQLRTEYKPFEAKQKLLGAYNAFLADSKIFECLPRVLGRHFFRKRKLPIQIDMKSPNLRRLVEKALSTVVFYIKGHGNSCAGEVACLDMNDSDITDNILAAVETLTAKLPGSWDNVMGVYLRTSKSKAIPLYVSYDDPSNVELPEEEDDDDSIEIDELSTMPNVKAIVHKDGRVKIKSIRETLKAKENESEVKNSEEQESLESQMEKEKSEKDHGNIIKTEAVSPVSNETMDNSITVDTKKVSRKKKKKIQKDSLIDFSAEESTKKKESAEPEMKNEKLKRKHKKISEIEIVSPKPNGFEDNKNRTADTKTVLRKKNKKIQEPSIINFSSEEKKSAENRKCKIKRKREESMLADKIHNSGSGTPKQATKKRKVESKCNLIKESQKSKKKKENRLRRKYM